MLSKSYTLLGVQTWFCIIISALLISDDAIQLPSKDAFVICTTGNESFFLIASKKKQKKTLGESIWPLWRSRINYLLQFFLFIECPDRPKALGMEDKRIPDSSIRASSAYNNNYRAAYGRLRSESGFGGWLAPTSDKNPWFQVNFGSIVTITQVATQGMSRFGARTMTYTLSHSGGSGSFVSYNNNQVCW